MNESLQQISHEAVIAFNEVSAVVADPTAIPWLMTSSVAAGAAMLFFWVDYRSATSRALCLWLLALGAVQAIPVLELMDQHTGSGALLRADQWSFLDGTLETLVIMAAIDWVIRVRATLERQARGQVGLGLLRLGQLSILFYWVMHWIEPLPTELRFDLAFEQPEALFHEGLWFYGLPVMLAMLLPAPAMVQIVRADIDPAERIRFLGLIAASPFLSAGLWMPPDWDLLKPPVTLMGQLIFFAGVGRYLLMRGERSQFLSQFLSPEVGRVVSRRGLAAIQEPKTIPISIVACDLRGFTAYARTVESEQVMALLQRFYSVVGDVATRFGATVKDHAGDGVLSLIGAPLAVSDPQHRAASMAVAIREEGRRALTESGLDLGIGVGVASGPVTVGALGGGHRLEYAAVGTAVNLAARLCDQADPWEILIDEATQQGLQKPKKSETNENTTWQIATHAPLSLKGFAKDVPAWALVDRTDQPS